MPAGATAAGPRHWLTGLLVLTALAIFYCDFPADLQNHTHWAKVAWIPFVSPPLGLRDSVLNIILFVPLGVVSRLRLPRRPVVCMAIGLALALAGEGTQVFSHGRVPSMTDVACNVIGTATGLAVAGIAGF